MLQRTSTIVQWCQIGRAARHNRGIPVLPQSLSFRRVAFRTPRSALVTLPTEQRNLSPKLLQRNVGG